LPSTSSPAYRFSSLFKPDPYRDFFRVLADSLDVPIVVISGDGRRILALNHAFALLTGFSRNELEDRPFPSLLPGDLGKKALGELQLAWDTPESKVRNIPMRTRDGTSIEVDIEARPIGPLGTALLLTCVLASKRKRESEGQKSYTDQLQTVVELASLLQEDDEDQLIRALDLGKILLDSTILGLYKISAFHPDYVPEGPLPAEFPPNLPLTAIEPLIPSSIWSLGHRTEHQLQKAARAAGLSTLRTAHIGSEEAWIGVLIAGWRDPAEVPKQVEEWMLFLANLAHTILLRQTQHDRINHLESNITELREEIGGQFSAVSDALLALDDKLCVVRANFAASEMLGYERSELQGLPVQDVIVGATDVQGTFLDALGHEIETERAHLTIHRRDGTPLPVHLRVVPIKGETQSRLLVVIQDRSEQKAYEDQREILAQRAILGEVTAILAHEVRNPINNISTGVQLVASRLGEDHPQYDSLERLRKECDRLNQLLSDVLFFARPLELKMEPLDLSDLMDRLLQRWSPRFNQLKIRHHTDFKPDLPRVLADPRTFEQVVLNLITNALQALSDGGTISINLSETTSNQGRMVELQIADTGPGIPPKVIDRIFDPFYTTKKDGTGLGLAISRRILTAHKGTIHVESFTDAGTVFTICVPVAEEDD
jgi:PAS domain S-box-containing protein